MQMTRLLLLERISKMKNVAAQQIFSRVRLLKCRFFTSFPSNGVPFLPNEVFAFDKKQYEILSKMEEEVVITSPCGGSVASD